MTLCTDNVNVTAAVLKDAGQTTAFVEQVSGMGYMGLSTVLLEVLDLLSLLSLVSFYMFCMSYLVLSKHAWKCHLCFGSALCFVKFHFASQGLLMVMRMS